MKTIEFAEVYTVMWLGFWVGISKIERVMMLPREIRICEERVECESRAAMRILIQGGSTVQ